MARKANTAVRLKQPSVKITVENLLISVLTVEREKHFQNLHNSCCSEEQEVHFYYYCTHVNFNGMGKGLKQPQPLLAEARIGLASLLLFDNGEVYW